MSETEHIHHIWQHFTDDNYLANVMVVGGYLARAFGIPTVIMCGILSDYCEDEIIHLTEISYIVKKLHENSDEFLIFALEFFRECDKDHDYNIGPRDLQTSFGLSNDKVYAVFKHYDVNKDVKLNLIDFMQFMIDNNIQAPIPPNTNVNP